MFGHLSSGPSGHADPSLSSKKPSSSPSRVQVQRSPGCTSVALPGSADSGFFPFPPQSLLGVDGKGSDAACRAVFSEWPHVWVALLSLLVQYQFRSFFSLGCIFTF